MSLRDVSYTADGLSYDDHRQRVGERSLSEFMQTSRDLIAEAASSGGSVAPLGAPETTDDFRAASVVPYPSEVVG